MACAAVVMRLPRRRAGAGCSSRPTSTRWRPSRAAWADRAAVAAADDHERVVDAGALRAAGAIRRQWQRSPRPARHVESEREVQAAVAAGHVGHAHRPQPACDHYLALGIESVRGGPAGDTVLKSLRHVAQHRPGELDRLLVRDGLEEPPVPHAIGQSTPISMRTRV